MKTLAEYLLGESVQQGGVQKHNALEDARTTMKLYKFDELAFETNAHMWDVDWWVWIEVNIPVQMQIG